MDLCQIRREAQMKCNVIVQNIWISPADVYPVVMTLVWLSNSLKERGVPADGDNPLAFFRLDRAASPLTGSNSSSSPHVSIKTPRPKPLKGFYFKVILGRPLWVLVFFSCFESVMQVITWIRIPLTCICVAMKICLQILIALKVMKHFEKHTGTSLRR